MSRRTRTWPYPGDSPVVVARQVAIAYRQLAIDNGVDVDDTDERMLRWGQRWVMPQVQRHDPEAWVSLRDAAELAHVEPDSISRLRRRGRLTGREVAPGKWEYRVSEILALSTSPRHRTPREQP